MEALQLNYIQQEIFNDILDFYNCEEHDIKVFEIDEYCEDHGISAQDEQQIYVYLYGVHEKIMYMTLDNYTRTIAMSMMNECDEAVQRCDERIDYEVEQRVVPTPSEPVFAPEWMTNQLVDMVDHPTVLLYNDTINISPITRPTSINGLSRST